MRQLSYIFYLILFVSFASLGQKKGLNYQAVIIDPNPIEVPGIAVTGQPLMNGKVTLRFTIRNSKGVDYEENQALTTDEFGLVNATIGAGVPKTGLRFETFDAIIWDAELKSLVVAVSFDNGQKYTEVSNQKLNFTPYALYAESVDYKNVRDSPTNLSQFKNDVGYLIPKDLDPLKQDIAKNSATIETNKKATEEKFLATQQTIALIDEKIAGNTKDITSINGTLLDHNRRIEENKSTIISTEQNLSSRIGVVQNITLATQNTVNNLTGAFESLSNKSTNIDLGAGNPSDQLYPTQKATKAYVDNTIYAAVGSGVPDATTLAAGKVKLAGDLGGTATNPTVPALANKENTANKSVSVQTDGTSNTMYPSVKAVKDYVDQATMGTALQATVDAKADKASPTLTGIPLAPTATANTNTTQIATTAFVQQALTAGVVDATSSVKGKIALTQDLGGTADSPTVPGLALKESLSNKSDNISLGNSTTAYPTQNAVKIYVDNQVSSASIADATDLVKGKIQLGGDLNGPSSSAATPVISNNAITTAKIGNLQVTDAKIATVSASKITGAVDIANGGTGAITAGGALTNLGAQASANLSTDISVSGDAASLTKYPAVKTIKDYVDISVAAATIADASPTLKGKIQLAGDLAGSAALPTVPGLLLKAPLESPTFTGTVSGITKAMVGLANADNTSDINKPVSSAAQTALNLKAPLESPTFTGAPVLPTATIGVTQSAGDNSTKLATTAFVESSVIAGTPDASTTTRGKIQLAGDLSGTALLPTVPGLLLKAPIESPTFTGTVAGITKAMVGLANADNTSDINKPVSSAAQTALNLKAPLESPTFTGAPVLPTATTGVTQASGDNSTKLATTAFVVSSVTAGTPDATSSATGKIQLAGDLSGTATSPTIATGAVTSTKILDGTIVNADINASAAIVDTKLATIATAGKVSNSATTATDANTASAIVARDANGNFTAGTITLSTLTASKGLFTDASKNLTSTGTLGTEQGGTGLALFNSGGAMYATSTSALTTGTLPITAGGTGSTTQNFVDLTTAQTIAGAKTFSSTIVGSVSGNAATVTNGIYSTSKLSNLAATTSAELAGVISDETGSGTLVFGTSPTFITPNLGTPSAAVLTSATGLPIATGISGLGTGIATALATPSSANLITAVTDETGTGALVFATSPTLVTPNLGVPSAIDLTNATSLPVGALTGILPITKGGTGSNTDSGALTALGAQSVANLSTDIAADATLTTKYPAVKTIKEYVDGRVTSATPNANATTLGKIQLAGDLSGTATSPTIAANAITTTKIIDGAVTSAKILDGEIVNADISATAAIVDTKLATIATTGKVSNSATTATNANTASAIVARDANGNFTAGTITADLTGLASKATNINGGSLGDIAFQSAANTTSYLPGNTTLTKKFLAQTGSGSISASPLWETLGTTDISNLGANVGTFLITPTSVNLANAMTNETGTGSVVFSTSPTLVSPTIGAANATSVTLAGASPSTGSAIIVAPAVSGSATITLPAVTGTLATLAGTETFTNKTFTSPIFTAPALGIPASGTLTNAIGLPLTSGVIGILPIANGGTGATSAVTALTALGAQSVANLSTDIATDAASLEKYPAVKTVKDYVDASVTTGAPDASASTKGKVQLAGDLSGTAALPTIATGAVTSAKILDGTIVDADINATAAIADTKLATIATAGKVSNSATTATNANTISTIVARDESGNFSAGTITANLTGTASIATNITGGAAGAIPYQTAANTTGLLTGNALASKRFLTQSGNGTLANAPVWEGVAVSDITGTLPVANGGTGVTTTAANLIFAGPTSGATASAPSFRRLDAADLPAGSTNYVINNGASIQANTSFNISGAGTIGTDLTVTGNTSVGGTLTVTGATTLLALNPSKGVFTDAFRNLTSTGTLGTNQGGTGMGSFNSGSAMYATSTSALTTGTLPTSAGGTGLTTYTSGGALFTTSTTAITSGTLPVTAGGTGSTTQNFVDLTTAQTIAGAKTFSSTIVGSISGNAASVTNGIYSTSKLSNLAATTSAELAGVISDETGSGALVFATSPTLVTPNLGTPSAAVLTSATGLPIATGVSGLGTGVATALATPSSANLSTAVTDETGTGALVFATSPTLVTPTLGVATGTSLSVSGQLTSSVAIGTAPLVVTSTTPVTNLSIGGNAATATTATNIAGGLSGSIPYQTAAGTTALLAKGTDGQVLALVSGLPAWATDAGITTMAAIGSVPNANGASISTNTLTLQPADASFGGVVTTAAQTFAGAKTFSGNTAVSGNSTFTVGAGATSLGGTLAVTGATTISSSTVSNSTSTGALIVTGGVGIGGETNIGGISTFSNATASTSTTTGALIVAGGVGIGGATYIGGQISIAGGTPGLGKVLTSNANGLATWSNNGGGVLSKTDSYTILATDNANILIYSGSAASKTITLPSAVTVGAGREITIKNIASVSVTVGSAGGTVISDSLTTTASTLAIGIEPSNNWIKAISDGTNWIILRALF